MSKRVLTRSVIIVLLAASFMVCTCGYAAEEPVGSIEISGANSTPTHTLYGQNYWCWDAYGDDVRGTEELARGLRLNVVRAGGYNNDAQSSYQFDPFDQAQVDEFVAYCRSIGAEPILQVSLLKNIRNKQATAEDAADWVTYCNITKKYAIKYWSIGNEPEYYMGKGKGYYSVWEFCKDFHRFSRAMKAVDPTIKILGPELTRESYYPVTGDKDWLTPFLTHCKGDFDIVALHRYPFNASECTISNALNDREHFRSVIRGVRKIMHERQLDHIPLGITEANVTWDGNPNHTNTASPPTYYAGLWLADSLGVALEENLWTMAYWSICEGWPIGFLEPRTHKPRPIYYVFQMYAEHFGPTIVYPVKVPKGFSVFASRNALDNGCVLMVVNKNIKPSRQSIQFSRFDARLVNREYDFPPYSITCLKIPDDGGAMQVISYTKEMADRGEGPQLIK